MEIWTFLCSLDNVTNVGSARWDADCPACLTNPIPRLRIRLTEDGTILLFCVKRCDYEDILGALDMTPPEMHEL